MKIGDTYVRVDDPANECVVQSVDERAVHVEAVGEHNKHRGKKARFIRDVFLTFWKPKTP